MHVKGELYLYNYAAKPGVKKQQLWIHKKSELTTLKLEVGELDTDKLKTDPTDLSRLSNVADNDAVGSDLSDELVKVNTTDSDKQNLEKKD